MPKPLQSLIFPPWSSANSIAFIASCQCPSLVLPFERVTIMSQTNNNAESCGATGDAWSSLIAEYGSTD